MGDKKTGSVCFLECVWNIYVYESTVNGGFPGGSGGKESAFNSGDPGSIPGLKDPLEKETAIHSSTPAWKIPCTEEPGGLQVHGVTKSQTRLSD